MAASCNLCGAPEGTCNHGGGPDPEPVGGYYEDTPENSTDDPAPRAGPIEPMKFKSDNYPDIPAWVGCVIPLVTFVILAFVNKHYNFPEPSTCWLIVAFSFVLVPAYWRYLYWLDS
jgi:hypothetical protein